MKVYSERAPASPTSAFGTKQTLMPTLSMSALGGKADMRTHDLNVR